MAPDQLPSASEYPSPARRAGPSKRTSTEPATRTELVIDDTVAAAIAAHAARSVPGVIRLEPGLSGFVTHLAGRARHQLRPGDAGGPASTEGVEASVDGGTARVHVDLSTSAEAQAATIAQAVQEAVPAALRADAGLIATEVSVSVLDITQPHAHPAKPRIAAKIPPVPPDGAGIVTGGAAGIVDRVAAAIQSIDGLALLMPLRAQALQLNGAGAALAVIVDPDGIEVRLVARRLPLPPLLEQAEAAIQAALLGTGWESARLQLVVAELAEQALAI